MVSTNLRCCDGVYKLETPWWCLQTWDAVMVSTNMMCRWDAVTVSKIVERKTCSTHPTPFARTRRKKSEPWQWWPKTSTKRTSSWKRAAPRRRKKKAWKPQKCAAWSATWRTDWLLYVLACLTSSRLVLQHRFNLEVSWFSLLDNVMIIQCVISRSQDLKDALSMEQGERRKWQRKYDEKVKYERR